MPEPVPSASGAPSTTSPGLPARAYAFLGCAILAFLLMLVAAFLWDCSRFVTTAHADALAAETEQRNQEERVITALGAAGSTSSEVSTAIVAYHAASGTVERDRLFSGILAAAGRAPRPSSNVDDPLLRRAADELAGAQNRRQIALRNRQEMVTAYNDAASGLRGRLGRKLTGLPARLD